MKMATQLIITSAWIILGMEVLPQMAQYQCTDNVDHTTMVGLENVTINDIMTLTTLHISAIQCAILSRMQSRPSYAYDPVSGQCFIRNVNLRQSGLLCGKAVKEARDLCTTPGEAYIAIGGVEHAHMQCLCGVTGIGNPNFVAQSITYPFNCIDTCKSSPCFVHLGIGTPCANCHGNDSFCKPTRIESLPIVSVCMKVV